MNKKVFAILHCIYVCCSGNPEVSGCGRSINPIDDVNARIAGGKETRPGDYPWMISLQEISSNKHFCGASVVNERWILTAAHCIPSIDIGYGNIQAVAGLHKRSNQWNSPVQILKFSKVVLHDFYNNFTFANDIALMKTETPIVIGGSGGMVNGICLPKTDVDPEGLAKVIGWGRTSFEDPREPDTLLELDVPIVPRKNCILTYGKHVDGSDKVLSTNICAGMENKDSCTNDSGGPLCQTSQGVSTIIGIVSFGMGCGDKLHPGVYTKVASYMPWIEKVIAEN